MKLIENKKNETEKLRLIRVIRKKITEIDQLLT
jgi:hypothetical protein